MSKTKKILAALLAALMLFTVLPVTVFAGFEPMFIEEADKYGKITWKVEGTVLKISGEGVIIDFCINGQEDNPLYGIETSAPWRDYRDKVTTIVIGEGISYVGRYAFNAFSKLTEVFLPSTIKEIGEYVFNKCDALKKVYYCSSEDSGFSYAFCKGNEPLENAEKVWGMSYALTISYTVKFSGNGGTGSMKEVYYEKDKAYNLPANAFKKSCYTFVGWNTKKDGSGTTYKDKASVSKLAKAGKSVTLYAMWKLKSDCYTVTYKLNGGKNNTKNPEVYSSTGKDKTLKNPTKSGYTFDGWYKNSKFTGSKITKIAASTKKNITLYAKWIKSYKIKFYANGGSGEMKDSSCVVGTAKTLPANKFKRSCYTFAGWNTKKDGSGKNYKNKASVKNLSKKNGATVKLYAKWKLKKNCYTVKYTLSGGINNSENPEAYSAKGKDITLKNPKKTGYTFKGWYKKSDFSGDKVTKITVSKKKNVKLYAKWSANKYTVKFNANGGTGKMSAKKCTYNKSYKLPANAFEKSDYTFAGWNTKKDGTGTTYEDKATIKNLTAKNGATVTLYAQWNQTVDDAEEKVNEYTVKFVANGGTGKMSAKKCTYNKSYKLPANTFEKDDYVFAGWNTKKDGTGTTYEDKATIKNLTAKNGATVTLYAQWNQTVDDAEEKVNEYTVKFDANGGEGNMSAKKCTYGKSYKLPANTFEKDDYVFAGWNTKKDGTGTTYEDKATIKNLTAKNGATVTLYAQWNQTVDDAEELEKVCTILSRTCEPLYLKKQGQSVSFKSDANNNTVWSVTTRANGTWKFINANEPGSSWMTIGATYCSEWSTPYLTMDSQDDNAASYRDALASGTYDYKNDPGKVLIAWSMFSSSTSKSDFEKMINNKISDAAFNEAIAKYNAWATSTYGASCVIVYGKDSSGKLIGKYAGSVYYNNVSNAATCHFVGINPKNTADYGKTVNKTVFY